MISTHILDTTLGSPASGVHVFLEKKENEDWLLIDKNETNIDGRIVFNSKKESGIYRLTFEVENYFKKNQQEHFFMNTVVVFRITNFDRKYHVPILLNPYGYSTYRGS
jgi:5-hydroxyisourate hydrolase